MYYITWFKILTVSGLHIFSAVRVFIKYVILVRALLLENEFALTIYKQNYY